MRHTRLHPRFALLFVLGLLIVLVVTPVGLEALQRPAVADFVAPLTPQQAQARVAAAQLADRQQREALARTLNAISPGSLPLVQTVFVTQTNHHLSDRSGFLTFWREHGGVLIFGYPLSEEIVEDGQIVQYFERVRFEYHPERLGQDGQIQLSLLGRELTADRAFPDGAPDGGERYFPETKHTLSGRFLKFWTKRGGLPIFGYPI